MGYKDGYDKEARKETNRKYYQKHYADNKQYYIGRARNRQNFLAGYVRKCKSNPCLDCGKKYPYYVMDFDHRPSEEKEANISELLGRAVSLHRLKKEINKCDLVCSNCHRIRTFRRIKKK